MLVYRFNIIEQLPRVQLLFSPPVEQLPAVFILCSPLCNLFVLLQQGVSLNDINHSFLVQQGHLLFFYLSIWPLSLLIIRRQITTKGSRSNGFPDLDVHHSGFMDANQKYNTTNSISEFITILNWHKFFSCNFFCKVSKNSFYHMLQELKIPPPPPRALSVTILLTAKY